MCRSKVMSYDGIAALDADGRWRVYHETDDDCVLSIRDHSTRILQRMMDQFEMKRFHERQY